MRIAIIRKKYVPGGGGAEKYTERIVHGLHAKGHELTVFAETFAGAPPDGVTCVTVPKRRSLLGSGTLSFHQSVQPLIDHDAFDIVYALGRTFPADVFRVTEQLHCEWMPIHYSRFAKYNPRHRSILNLERQVLTPGHVKAVVTNSELVKRQVMTRYGFPDDQVHVICNGVDRTVYYPCKGDTEQHRLRELYQLDEDVLVACFAAANFKIKGLHSAISAVAALPEELRGRVRLLVAGGDNPIPYQQQAMKEGIGTQVLFIGKQADMRSVYAASDILLYPSLYEPFANVCLEACACGIPVITTQRNGACQLIANGANGYIVQNGDDVDPLRHCLEDFCSRDSAERMKMGQAAVQAAMPYTWEAHLDSLDALFERVKKRNT